MTDIVKRLRNPPFGTESSERNLMTAAADEIERMRAIVSHVETWVSNPPTSYSMMALDGLFSQTREMIRHTPTE